jgi:hypothetical protein
MSGLSSAARLALRNRATHRTVGRPILNIRNKNIPIVGRITRAGSSTAQPPNPPAIFCAIRTLDTIRDANSHAISSRIHASISTDAASMRERNGSSSGAGRLNARLNRGAIRSSKYSSADTATSTHSARLPAKRFAAPSTPKCTGTVAEIASHLSHSQIAGPTTPSRATHSRICFTQHLAAACAPRTAPGPLRPYSTDL